MLADGMELGTRAPTVLAIGNSGPADTESFRAVANELRKRGHDAILFTQDLCLTGRNFLSVRVSGGVFHPTCVIDGCAYDLDSFDAVYYLKPHLPPLLLEFQPAEFRPLIHNQHHALRRSLWSILRKKRWLNDPWAAERAESKIYQLREAAAIGLTIPDTVITADPSTVHDFYETHERDIVVKLLEATPVYRRVMFTTPLTPDDMRDLSGLLMAPAIFQERVPKSFDIRVTIVGDRLFAASIDSQSDPATATDWRRKPLDPDRPRLSARALELDSAVSTQLLALMEALNLRFGCIDMVLTPDGRYVFLEVNPNGQWQFLAAATGFDIAAAIADVLAFGDCRSASS